MEAYQTEGLIITLASVRNKDMATVLAEVQIEVDKQKKHRQHWADKQISYDLSKAFQLKNKNIRKLEQIQTQKIRLDKVTQDLEMKQFYRQLELHLLESAEDGYNFWKTTAMPLKRVAVNIHNDMYQKLVNYITNDLESK
jgi:hypothetical protein